MPTQLQPTPFLCTDLVRQRLVEPVEERARILVGFEQERVDAVKVGSQPETARILPREDELSFEGLSVCVRPSDESAGALVGIPATLPSR